MKGPETLIKESFDFMGLPLNESQIQAFCLYGEMLRDWNQKFNLTAITDMDQMAEKHFADSCAPLNWEILERGCLIDVGSGAGFPGIPLKILRPALKVVLLDSLGKRVGFLEAVIRALDLKDIRAVHGRAEDFGKDPEYREQFDYAVARAVAPLPLLAEWCLPFVKVGGQFVAYKARTAREEVEQAHGALEILGGGALSLRSCKIPGPEAERNIINIKKETVTPAPYPRKPGMAAKKPL